MVHELAAIRQLFGTSFDRGKQTDAKERSLVGKGKGVEGGTMTTSVPLSGSSHLPPGAETVRRDTALEGRRCIC
jgi:hypothetical protein